MKRNFFDEDEDNILTPPIAPRKTINQNSKKVLMIILPLVLFLLAAIYFFAEIIKSPKKNYTDQDSNNEAREVKAASHAPSHYEFVELGEMTLNLIPSNNKPNYLRINLTLQLSSKEEAVNLKDKLPIITDTVQTFLKELRAGDFSGSGATLKLKEELLKRINKTSYPVEVNDVLFKEILVN